MWQRMTLSSINDSKSPWSCEGSFSPMFGNARAMRLDWVGGSGSILIEAEGGNMREAGNGIHSKCKYVKYPRKKTIIKKLQLSNCLCSRMNNLIGICSRVVIGADQLSFLGSATLIPQWMYKFVLPHAMNEFILLPALGITCFIDLGHSH